MYLLNKLCFGKVLVLHHCMGSGKTGCSVSTSLLTSEKCKGMMCLAQETCKIAKALSRRHKKLGFKSSSPLGQSGDDPVDLSMLPAEAAVGDDS